MSKLIIKPNNDFVDPKLQHRQSRYGDIVSKPYMRAVIMGASNSGKTTLMVSYITEIYKDTSGRSIFDLIYIFSITAKLDASFKPIFNEMEKINNDKFDPYDIDNYVFDDLDYLDTILKNQKYIVKYCEDKKIYCPNLLIIFDDILHENTKNKALNNICLYRHLRINCWYNIQRYTYLPRNVRVNSNSIIIFRCDNSTDLEYIVDDYKGALSKKNFMQIYEAATAKKYNFLFINLDNEKNKKYMRNFESYLYIKE